MKPNGKSLQKPLICGASLVAFLTIQAVTSVHAEVKLPPVFSDHMVLQRDSAVPVWGTASPGEKVTVTFGGKSRSAVTGPDGKWSVDIGPLATNSTPATLTVSSNDPNSKIKNQKFEDVLVGEVWVGSGQSNMEQTVRGYIKNDPVLAAAAESSYPQLRLVIGARGGWAVSGSASNSNFSAQLFYFGLRLHQELKVPVGLILGAIGGTPSGRWLTEEMFENNPACREAAAKADAAYTPEAAQKKYEEVLATMHGVPLLYLNQITPEGQDGNSAWMDSAPPARRDPENLVGRTYDWGGHHLDMLDGINQMLALFVKKASKYRLADEIPNGMIPDLKPLTAAQGWLATSPFEAQQFPMTPEKEYKGDKTRAFWYFDKEMAEAALNFRAENRKKKPQFVTLLDKDGKLLNPVEGSFGTVKIPRDDIAEDDGFTYRMNPAFFDKLIEKEKLTDKPAGHAANGDPVVVPPAAGNLVQVEKNTFRYRRFHRGRHGHAWFTIYHPGDAQYSRISQPAGMWTPEEERKGREQAIDFPAIPNVLVGAKEIQLNAKSNVDGQVVEYYLVSGPAELTGNVPDKDGFYPKYTGNTLRFAPIPPNAKYPVKVTVVAYQLGRSKEPFVKGAKEVVREFMITKGTKP